LSTLNSLEQSNKWIGFTEFASFPSVSKDVFTFVPLNFVKWEWECEYQKIARFQGQHMSYNGFKTHGLKPIFSF